jgi:hypothetical protein
VTESTERQLGRHDAEIVNLTREVAEMRKDMKTILTTLSEARGGWKTLMLVAGMAGAVGAFAHQIAIWMGFIR